MLFIVNPIVFKKKALPVLEEVQDTTEEDEKEEEEDDLSR